MNKRYILLTLAVSACSVLAAGKPDLAKIDVSKLPPAATQAGVTYAKDIRPMLEASCTRCHGEERPKGRLRLDSLEGALKGGKDGEVIVPGDSTKSLLVIAAARIDNDTAMPPKHRPGGGRRGGPPGQGGPGGPPPGQGGFGGPPGGPPPGGHGFGPPPKPLTEAQVSLLRAWVDQGAK